MDIEAFIEKTPFLYHLTSKSNLSFILKEKKLLSADALIKLSKDDSLLPILRMRRPGHQTINIGGETILIRDQRPISEKALSKCLTDGWKPADYYEHLNKRVFFWPNLDRLQRHYDRYTIEQNIIIRLNSKEIINANPHVKFSRLNSGATRANSYLGGIAPARGPDTFVPASEFGYSIRFVAEVTFEHECILNGKLQISNNPMGKWTSLKY